MPIRAVFLDIGETLVDETRMWGAWADALEVPPLTLFGLLGAAIARGEHHRSIFGHFTPGRVERARSRMRSVDLLVPGDLYPDVFPCLAALRARGLQIGLTGNQPSAMETALVAAGVAADVVGSSERWGAEKPAPEYFRRLLAESGHPAAEVLHVGDRLDNDVLPALQAGLHAALLRRGPWGLLHAAQAEPSVTVLDSLMQVPELLDSLR